MWKLHPRLVIKMETGRGIFQTEKGEWKENENQFERQTISHVEDFFDT